MKELPKETKELREELNTIKVGSRLLKEITSEEVAEIVMIENCIPSLEYWNKPEFTRFDNTMFSDTVIIDYFSFRKDDNERSSTYTLYFNFKDFRFHYIRDFEKKDNNYQPNGQRIGLPTLRYLIKQGFSVPII